MSTKPLSDDLQALKAGFELYLESEISNWDYFAELFSSLDLQPQQHWIKAGDHCQHLCYILEGLVRVYYIDQAGNEVNQHFYQAHEMIAPLDALIGQAPCQYYVQALEPTRLMQANYHQLSASGENNTQWLRIEIKVLQTLFIKNARREARLLLGNGEQRYRWFCKEYPQLLERITQYHIASFLGITPVSLSRLRKKNKQHNTPLG